jgi:hypothetical protein
MKNLHLTGICLAMLILCATASAQKSLPVNEPNMNKARLFNDLPERIPVHILDLQSLMNSEKGGQINLKLGESVTSKFAGTIISKANKYNNNIRSVVIRSSNFNGATFTLSSSAQPNGTVKFTGRILSLQHADLYELQELKGQYVLVKKNFYDLVNE